MGLGGLGAFYLLCTLNLLYLRSAEPAFTMVQAQRRVESWFESVPYQKSSSFLPLAAIPLEVQRAVVAAEDMGFYDHGGVDWAELKIIWTEDLKRGRLRGGSTISQQLVKNLFLTTHRSALRKVLEFTLVPIAEGVLSKDRILELYLNVIEWGPGVYGVEEAARHHYGTPASTITREQAARLAACIPAPRTRKPHQMNSYSQEILRRTKLRGW